MNTQMNIDKILEHATRSQALRVLLLNVFLISNTVVPLLMLLMYSFTGTFQGLLRDFLI